MTDEELKAALAQIVADAEKSEGELGPVDEMQAIVKVGLVRAMLERLP